MDNPHDFQEKRAQSCTPEIRELVKVILTWFCGKTYKIVSINELPGGLTPDQRDGKDWEVTVEVASGRRKLIYFDLKVRPDDKPWLKEPKDIFFDYISDEAKKTPGWIELPLACDFILYIWLPIKHAVIFPFLPAAIVWKVHKEMWLKMYGSKRVPNKGWVTLGCPIPLSVLFHSMDLDAMEFIWGGESPGRRV